jgi:hypothetical protein
MKHASSSDRPPLSRRSLSLLLGGILLASAAPVTAGITSYGAFKGAHFEQLSAGAPTATSGESHGAYFFVKVAAEEEILLATVQPPGALTPQLLFPSSDDPTLSEADSSFASLSALNAAVPDGAIVLLSGMGPDAQSKLSVGVGTLAGSTIMLLTLPWAACGWLGRVELSRDGSRALYGSPLAAGRGFSHALFHTGVQTSAVVVPAAGASTARSSTRRRSSPAKSAPTGRVTVRPLTVASQP